MIYTPVHVGESRWPMALAVLGAGALRPGPAGPAQGPGDARRSRWRMLWRWLALLLTPYILVPWLSIALMVPSLLLWGFTSAHGLSRKLPDHDLGLGIALACAVAIACSFASHRWAVMMAQRRRAKLLPFLADPTRG